MADELKPCLLCNGTSVGFRDHGLPETQIGCNDCGLTTRYYPSRAAAITAWNTRPAPKADSALVEGQPCFSLAELIETRLLGVEPDEQDLVLEDDDWRTILAALSDRDVVLEGLLGEAHEMLAWCGGILDEDTKAPAELAARIDSALKGGVDE